MEKSSYYQTRYAQSVAGGGGDNGGRFGSYNTSKLGDSGMNYQEFDHQEGGNSTTIYRSTQFMQHGSPGLNQSGTAHRGHMSRNVSRRP